MRSRSNQQVWLLPRIAGAVLLLLLILPATGWIVRTHLSMEAMRGPESTTASLAAAARSHPSDYSIQLAHALNMSPMAARAEAVPADHGNGNDEIISRLTALTQRFPNEPAGYATLLRYLTLGRVRISTRGMEQDRVSGTLHDSSRDNAPGARPEDLALFEATARRGMALEPDNGFFPFMLSAALFDQRQDVEAIAAIQQAARASRWDDHAAAEPDACLRLSDAAIGTTPAVTRTVIMARVLLPHYAFLRAAARVAMYDAEVAEQEGRASEGLAIRHALMQCGSRMAVDSPTLIASLVGVAITHMAAVNPGSLPPVGAHHDTSISGDERQRQRDNEYLAYLHRIGEDREATWAQVRLDTTRQLKSVIKETTLSSSDGWMRSIVVLEALWAAGLMTLSNALLLLLFAAAAFAVARYPLPKLAPAFGMPDPAEARFILHARLLRIALGAILICGVVLWQLRAIGAFATPFVALGALSGQNENGPNELPYAVGLLLIVLANAIPILLLAASGLLRRGWNVSWPAAIGRVFRGSAIPCACCLALIYGALVVGTVRQERCVNGWVTRCMHDEGRNNARDAGRAWPTLPAD